jgi:hypothetical protein
VHVNGLSGVIAVAAGDYTTVALKSDGTVWDWGYNEYGQLGDNTTINHHTPLQVTGLSGVTAVAAGTYHTVALKSDGAILDWGGDEWGQLGGAPTTQQSPLVEVSGFSVFPACGSMAACDAATGMCVAPTVVTGTACNDGDMCSQPDTCQAGVCVAGTPVQCVASNECHDAGTCEASTGVCSNDQKVDGSKCSLGTCKAGNCTPLSDAGTAGSGSNTHPEGTIDLSCRLGAPSEPPSTSAGWLGAIAVLALLRRRPRRLRTQPQFL